MDETRSDHIQAEPDADLAPSESAPAVSGGPVAEGPVTEERVLDAIRQVDDPELGINIVDLGLVYEVAVSPEGAVHVEYTLTTMGCPIGPLIEHQMQSFLSGVPG